MSRSLYRVLPFALLTALVALLVAQPAARAASAPRHSTVKVSLQQPAGSTSARPTAAPHSSLTNASAGDFGDVLPVDGGGGCVWVCSNGGIGGGSAGSAAGCMAGCSLACGLGGQGVSSCTFTG